MNTGKEIAIIGISGRFPMAGSKEIFWNNLIEGKECVKFFKDEELISENIEESLIKNPNYVKAKAQLENIDMFDCGFFATQFKVFWQVSSF